MIHALKQETAYFQLTIKNKKNYEIRLNDRNFAVGDYIALNEWDPIEKNYTGRSEICEIESILNSDDFPEGLKEGYVILGIAAINEVDWPRIFKGFFDSGDNN